jgi:DNA modification methylase
LDIFAGSGTTGAVAKKLNRKYILIEKSENYVNLIKERLTDKQIEI